MQKKNKIKRLEKQTDADGFFFFFLSLFGRCGDRSHMSTISKVINMHYILRREEEEVRAELRVLCLSARKLHL